LHGCSQIRREGYPLAFACPFDVREGKGDLPSESTATVQALFFRPSLVPPRPLPSAEKLGMLRAEPWFCSIPKQGRNPSAVCV
jgi:hypothetical protein